MLALGYCEERRYGEAAEVLAIDAADHFASLAYDLTWLFVACVYAHVAPRLAMGGVATPHSVQSLSELLAPWQDQIAYTGAGAWGCVSHYLGMLDLASGDHEASSARLQQAQRRAALLPAPIWVEHTRLEMARCLIAQNKHGEAERLLRETCLAAQALGCRTIALDAGELLAAAAIGEPVSPR